MTILAEQQNAVVPKRLVGKTALVTGGSRGIGAAIAQRLAQEGATVAISYNGNQRKAEEVVAKITELGGKAFAFHGNVASEPQTVALVDEVVKKVGQIDILVNNAGVYETASLDKIDLDHYNRLFDVNVKGVIATTIAVLPELRDGGRIINISSVAAKATVPEFSIYSATKAAVNSLTQIWAQELGKRGITVNAVAPGPIVTDMFHSVPEEVQKQLATKTALGRVGQPEEIASTVAFLASNDASLLTGEIIYVSGGLNA